MSSQKTFKVGTLIRDMGKLGVVYRVIEIGSLETNIPMIDWRENYEIYYFDGVITMMGCDTLRRLVDEGAIKIIHAPTGSEEISLG